MRILRNLLGAAAVALFGLGAVATCVVPALALVVPASYPPRAFQTQQTHYIRITVPFNACNYVSLACSFKAGTLPYNAFLVRAYSQSLATFTGATTMTAQLGTASGGSQIAAAFTILTAGVGVSQTLASLGENVVGNGATQTGTNGGFDVWVTLTATVAVPTAGLATIILEYIGPNDGGCAPVPMNTTPAGC
jgi:hypothetical protein